MAKFQFGGIKLSPEYCDLFYGTKPMLFNGNANLSNVVRIVPLKIPPFTFYGEYGSTSTATHYICGPLYQLIKEFAIKENSGYKSNNFTPPKKCLNIYHN